MANLLTLRMIKKYTRPVISLQKDVTCLIDTGADTLVWTRGSKRLLSSFQVELVRDKKYTIRNIGVEYPTVEIEHEKIEYSVSPRYSLVDNTYLEKVYSFANE